MTAASANAQSPGRAAPAHLSGACTAREISEQAEWTGYFEQLPFAAFQQSWSYGEVRRSQGRKVVRLLIERAGTPIALCQVVQRKKFGFPVLTRIEKGPLFFSPAPEPDDVLAALAIVRRRYRLPSSVVLLVTPGLQSLDEAALAGLGYRKRDKVGWRSALVDLRKTEDDLRKQLNRGWRNHLNRSMKGPLELELTTGGQHLDWVIEHHEKNMLEREFASTPGELVRSLVSVAPGDVVVARALLDGEPVAFALVVRFAHFAEYLIGWYGAPGREHNAGNFLMWRAMLEMKRRGCQWFDLGGYEDHEGFGKFKAGIKGDVYRLAGEWFAI